MLPRKRSAWVNELDYHAWLVFWGTGRTRWTNLAFCFRSVSLASVGSLSCSQKRQITRTRYSFNAHLLKCWSSALSEITT